MPECLLASWLFRRVAVLGLLLLLCMGRAQAQVSEGTYAAQQDTAFQSGSHLVLPLAPSAQQVDNLTLLGRVWGLVKYYHPAVAQGRYDMDAELFRLLPKVVAARNASAGRRVLSAWLTQLGPVTGCAGCAPVPGVAANQQPDLAWLREEKQLGQALSRRLLSLVQPTAVLTPPSTGLHYYVVPQGPANPVPEFVHERAYAATSYPDAGLRLLALFRYWNYVQYFYPYKHLLDEAWGPQLPAFIPRLLHARDALEYRLALQELMARLADAHCTISPQDAVLNPYWGLYNVPARVQFVNDQVVIQEANTHQVLAKTGLQNGDLLLAIDGEPVTTLVARQQRLHARPNLPTQRRELARRLLWGATPQVTLQVQRQGQVLTLPVRRLLRSKLDQYRALLPADSAYRRLRPSIGYVQAGRLQVNQKAELRACLQATKGVIVDLRSYPQAGIRALLTDLFQDQPRVFVLDRGADLTCPGRFLPMPDGPTTIAQPSAEPPYAGKVLLLVNEYTQSNGEYATMALRTTPHALIVGSQTAGTDGNVTDITLPGQVATRITTLGEYYPDGRETQRVGIVPDVEVRPTVEGLQQGRDEVLEKAIQLIEPNP